MSENTYENATAVFHNFTDKPFIGYWDGRPHTFKPGQQVMMSLSLAEHYAKHLTNSILFEMGQITAMSPKKPLEVKVFMNIFNKACIYNEQNDVQTPTEADIAVHNFKDVTPKVKTKVDNKPQQVIKVPKDDDDDFEDDK